MADMAGKHALRLWGLWSFSLKDTQQRRTHTFSFKKVSPSLFVFIIYLFYLLFFYIIIYTFYTIFIYNT